MSSEPKPGLYEERRLHPRLEVPLTARYRLPGEEVWSAGRVHNLSAGGAALATAEQLAVPSVLERLSFDLPGQESPVEVAAAVLRCEQLRPIRPDELYLSGVHFLNLEGELFERVRLFVYRRLSGA